MTITIGNPPVAATAEQRAAIRTDLEVAYMPVVASEAAMIALTGVVVGSRCLRSDVGSAPGTLYELGTLPASEATNWVTVAAYNWATRPSTPTTSLALAWVDEDAVASDSLTIARTGTATRVDAAGVIVDATAATQRIDHDSVTLAVKGLLVEPTAVNAVVNGTFSGAAVGTPGTLPTGWSKTAGTTFTVNVVATGTENGIPYIDLQFVATTANAGTHRLAIDEGYLPGSDVAARAWCLSAYIKGTAGSLTGVSFNPALRLEYRTAGGGLDTPSTTQATHNVFSGSGDLVDNRFQMTGTSSAATAEVVPLICFANTADCDFTIRLGGAQLERGTLATSLVKTTGTVVTRQPDNVTVAGNDFTPWYDTEKGTIVIAAQVPTVTAEAVLMQIDDGTQDNRITLSVNSSGHVIGTIFNNGLSQGSVDAGIVTSNTEFKVAFTYSSAGFGASLNGAAAVEDANGALPPFLSITRFGANSSTFYRCWLSSFSFANVASTAAELAIASALPEAPDVGATPINPADIGVAVTAEETFLSIPAWYISLEANGVGITMHDISEAGHIGVVQTDLGAPYGTMRFGKVADPAAPARTVYLTRMHRYDAQMSSAPRVELSGIFGSGPKILPDQTWWLGCGVYPHNYPAIADNDSQTVMQIHGTPSGPPPMALYWSGSGISVVARYNRTGPNEAGIYQKAIYDAADTVSTTLATIEPLQNNAWTYLVIKTKWKHNAPTGTIQVWRNNVQVANYTGYFGFANEWVAYQFAKFGQYHWIANYNPWTSDTVPRDVLLRAPTMIKDPTGSTYTANDIHSYLLGR